MTYVIVTSAAKRDNTLHSHKKIFYTLIIAFHWTDSYFLYEQALWRLLRTIGMQSVSKEWAVVARFVIESSPYCLFHSRVAWPLRWSSLIKLVEVEISDMYRDLFVTRYRADTLSLRRLLDFQPSNIWHYCRLNAVMSDFASLYKNYVENN